MYIPVNVLIADGGFSEWGPWSDCCNNAFKNRTRRCDNPPPKVGGKDCEGETTQTQECEGTSRSIAKIF